MAIYTYQTATEPVEIEVEEYWETLLKEADAEESNDDRKHIRPDHKYAPGKPISLDGLVYEGHWAADKREYFGEVELSADLENAFRSLTDLQRRYLIMNRIEGLGYTEIARLEGKRKETIFGIVEGAVRKLKKII